MKYVLPKLNFSVEKINDLMSVETISYHYDKHHQTYITNLNNLLPGSPFEKMTIDEIVKKATGPIFNNAAQTWNHTFYWMSVTDKITAVENNPQMLKEINSQFETVANFKEKFMESAKSLFGSGWTWLVKDASGKLSIVNCPNADIPKGEDIVPLLVCDVWEHAYYIDFRNVRANYLQAFWNHIDWNFVEKNFHSKETIKLHSLLTSSI